MIVGAASGLTQSTLNQPAANRNPLYRTLFNISILVLTAEASGQVYVWLGGTPSTLDLVALAVPLAGMAFTYFFVNTVPIAIAIALATNQSAWRIWRTDFRAERRRATCSAPPRPPSSWRSRKARATGSRCC